MISNHSLWELVKACREIEDFSWNMELLNGDFLSRKLDVETKAEIIEDSAACGVQWACEIRKQYPGLEIWDILKKLQVPVEIHAYDRPGKNQMIFFAQYRKGVVYLSQDRIRDMERLSEENDLHELLGEYEPAALLAAHEMFHHIESQNPGIVTRSMRIKGCGLFRGKGCPYQASEIGAFAFAKELCGVSFHPRTLEIIAIYEQLPETAKKMVQNMQQLKTQ